MNADRYEDGVLVLRGRYVGLVDGLSGKHTLTQQERNMAV